MVVGGGLLSLKRISVGRFFGLFKGGPGLNFAYLADDVCFESFFLNLSKSFWILFHYLFFLNCDICRWKKIRGS